jgi:NCS1 family nucleobase:cation symporter-1
MTSYFIYHVFQTPFLLIPTHKLNWLFLAKTVLVPPMALAMVIYLAVKAGNGGDFFHEPPTVSGSTRAWLWLGSMTSLTGEPQ